MYPYVFSLHVLAATIWTGGHLVLALAVLPRALRTRSPQTLLQFEQAYEHVGMAALAIQVATGLWLALQLVPDWTAWVNPGDAMERAVTMKLALLLATALVAAHARARVIPNLSAQTLPLMAWHVGAVTLLGVAFVLTGVSFRYGGVGG
ncbi:Copper resistance protein D [Oryzisolibacter propanilivorax]|uniref:Copper resistance protein D n=1 Tax=Oryzisolibacter propanilivorax TaxID=1527607 RepID=A0A1G9PFV4_9BURK|nr:CopD family protein [Oryzisolibacter propanilivorax]SDL97381.1 Copper resistance protein D [Oryzisolibacter propanilivorax]